MRGSGRSRHGVFISYARADGESSARALQARLEADAPDIAAWLDRYEIEGGVGWWTQIEEALDRAEFLILIMTPAAMRSDNTRREWRSARQRGVCVYPVKGCPDDQLDFASLPAWMRKAHFYDPQLEWPKLIAHLRRGCTATRVPFMAPSLSGFVGRAQQSHIVRALLDDSHANGRVVALRGAGGFGKTTLAAAVCHDEQIIDGFDDGILWVTLGQSPHVLIELVKLYAALTGERPGFVDVEDAARELALKLDNRNCLLVIDDAWNVAHVRPFVIGASGCARLITTRLHDLTAGMARIDIEQMSSAEALTLLLSRAGVTRDDLAPFREVTERLGDWPLLVKLAGSAMRQRIERGDTPENALDYVRRALDKRGITAFDTQDPTDRSGAVGLTLAASLDLLDERDRVRCMELAIFPQNAAIALGTAARVWGLDDLDSEDLARKLDDLALIDFDLQRDRLRMHDVLRSYLLKLLPDASSVHVRLLDSWGDPYRLPDIDAWRGYAFHMARAGRGEALKALLLDVRWLDARLRATDIGSLIGDFEFVADDAAATLVRDALRLSAPAVADDPRQLRTQLLGRLLSRHEPDLIAMRERATQAAAGPWLRLLHPSLDAPGGMLIMTLVGHTRAVTSLVMDSQARTVVSGSEDGTVRVWELRHGQLLRTFEHRRLGVRAVATTADGRFVLSGGADGMLYLWETVRGELVARFSGEARKARTAVALSADGTVAVCGSREKDLTVCDLGPLLTPPANAASPKAVLHSLSGHGEPVTSVALSADGSLAISGSDDGTLRVWDVKSGALQRTVTTGSGAVNAVALSADGRVALSGSGHRTIALWNLEDGTCIRTLSGHDASVTAVAAGQRRAISGSSDQRACLWNLESGELLARLDGHGDAVTAVTIDTEGTIGATASNDRTIKVWRFDDIRAVAASDAHAGAVVSLLFSPDGRLCASGGGDGRIKIRDVASGRVHRTIETNGAPVRSLAFTTDGRCVLSAGIDDQTRLWTLDDGVSTWIPIRHSAPIDSCTLSAMARYMVTACSDRFVYLWDVPSGGLVEKYSTRRLFDHLIEPSPRRSEQDSTDDLRDEYLPGERVFHVTLARISDDGSRIVLSGFVPDAGGIRTPSRQQSSDAGALLVFDPRSRAISTVRTPHAEQVSAVAVDALGTRLLWARADHHLELWDLETEECITTLRGHRDTVNAVAFTPEGRHAVSCSRDRSVRVWDLATGECVASFIADAALRSLAVAPDGTFGIGDVAGRVHFLRLMN